MTILDQHFLIRPNAAGVLDSKNPQGTNQGTNLFDGRAIIRRGTNQTDAFDGRASVRTSAIALRDGKAIVVNNSAPVTPLIDSTALNIWGMWPNSRMDAIAPPSVGGNTGFAAILKSWACPVFDYIKNRYVPFGGGHTDYYGNEVCAFDILTGTWVLLRGPSNPPAINTGYASDGRPVSRHGYGNNVYAPGQMVCMGAGGIASNGFSSNQIDHFSFSTNDWTTGPNMGGGGQSDLFGFSVYNKVTGLIWGFRGEDSGAKLNRYDPVAKTITQTNCTFGFYNYAVADVDTKRNQILFWYQGVGLYRIDLNNPNNAPVLITTTGTAVPSSPQAPGLQYDPVNDQFVFWNGGQTLYALAIPATLTSPWTWSVIPLGAGSSATPTQPTDEGTLGKFRYIPDKHAVMVFNQVSENGYFRKLPYPVTDVTFEFGAITAFG